MLAQQILNISFFLKTLSFFAIASFIALAIAKKNGFFKLDSGERTASIKLKFVFLGFFIYEGVSFLSAWLVEKTHFFYQGELVLYKLSPLFFLNDIIISCLLIILCLNLKRKVLKNILKEGSFPLWNDIRIGFLSWFLAFPLVMFCSHLLEALVVFVFKAKEIPDQIAIEYLKSTYGHPSFFILALINIIIFAPLIEEFLFRGLLQTFLRKNFGLKTGIILTSIIFALFHFKTAQKYNNIVIVTSLFILSLFLGFLYEKRKSLISPICLHAAFNSITILNLLIFKE